MKEKRPRSVIKAISWRCFATLTTIAIVYLFTKKLILSLEVGFVEVVAKFTLYYIHERMWGKVSWGRSSHPLQDIPVSKPLTQEDKDKIKESLKNMGYL